ncbi:MAG: LemA family protein [Hylemonella sp.]|nr:LemA family protein [Hylemonella sp.]MDH5708183.1 LemA family protein [Hylemonella sp.]
MPFNSYAIWTLGAVLLFWAFGAYNRLVRLRSQAIRAQEGLAKQLMRQIALVHDRCGAVTVQGRPGAPASLLGAAEQLEGALRAAQLQPLQSLPTQALSTAWQVLEASWSRVASAPPDLAGSVLPDALRLQWQEMARDAEEARDDFNQKVVIYNQAIAQFPALLLAGLFGWQRAETLGET